LQIQGLSERLADGASSSEASAAHAAACACPAAQQLREWCDELSAEVERLRGSAAAAQQEGQAALASAAAAAQAQQQAGACCLRASALAARQATHTDAAIPFLGWVPSHPADASPLLQALQQRLSALQSGEQELRELRSSAYAAVHRMRQAAREHGGGGGGSFAAAGGGGEGPIQQQLKQALEGLLSLLQASWFAGSVRLIVGAGRPLQLAASRCASLSWPSALFSLQERAQLVSALQQHLTHQLPPAGGAASPAEAALGGAGGSGLPLEASQRAVIRSLASQLAELQASATGQQILPAAAGLAGGGDTAQLLGLLGLVGRHLAALERAQQQLEASLGGPRGGGEAAQHGGGAEVAHAAATLGAELLSLRATCDVAAAEVRRLAPLALVQSAVGTPGGASLCCCRRQEDAPLAGPAALPCSLQFRSLHFAGLQFCVLCLSDRICRAAHAGASPPAPPSLQPAPSPGGDAPLGKAKWKARCKEAREQLAASRRGEAAMRAELTAAQQEAAAAAARQEGAVAALQGRVEELAAAGSQLEAALREAAEQLEATTQRAQALEAELGKQRRRQQAAVAEASSRAAAAEVGRSLVLARLCGFKGQPSRPCTPALCLSWRRASPPGSPATSALACSMQQLLPGSACRPAPPHLRPLRKQPSKRLPFPQHPPTHRPLTQRWPTPLAPPALPAGCSCRGAAGPRGPGGQPARRRGERGGGGGAGGPPALPAGRPG
jgi:hypothetical protein